MSGWAVEYQVECKLLHLVWEELYDLDQNSELLQYYDSDQRELKTDALVARVWNQEAFGATEHNLIWLMSKYTPLMRQEVARLRCSLVPAS
ncbi:MAG: hypothetical protein ABIP54_01340 [Candidatus Andersenbacteria bacterium]